MQGKIVLVTGATNGIGKEAARGLAKLGAQVVIVGRNPQKTEETAKEIIQTTGNDRVDWIIADLSVLAGIRSTADQFTAKYARLDVLLNNAGAFFAERQTSADGFEMTFALNHLSYFYLTHLLLDILKASAPSRIVSVSSDAHRAGRGDVSGWPNPSRYNGFAAYSNSKLANVLFTAELARRLKGTSVTAHVMHPGFVRTGFGRNNRGLMSSIIAFMQRWALTPEQGADTAIYLASAPEVAHTSGKYWVKRQAVAPHLLAQDQDYARKLWELSERIITEKAFVPA
ncbi:MAG: SDR family oxidoreductase [Anaerolineae bacterium]